MLTNLKCLIDMDQFINTSWLGASLTSLYVGLQSKLMFIQLTFTNANVENIKNIALILGIISTTLYVVYMFTKLYNQILETKVLKRKNKIKKLFTFEDEETN